MTGPVRFKVAELVSEVMLMQKMAEGFLDSTCSGLFDQLKGSIEVLYRSNNEVTIAVEDRWPIRTRNSHGGYELGKRGGFDKLYGELVFKWELAPYGNPGKNRQATVSGKASSSARLKVSEPGAEVTVASWRMEIGGENAPGAFFHAQIPDTYGDRDKEEGLPRLRMWPPWLSVPRIPIPPMTPMLALEFILAEIFQDEWPQHLASGSFGVRQWREMQIQRFVRFYEWQREITSTSGWGSPITTTKAAKPRPDFFVS